MQQDGGDNEDKETQSQTKRGWSSGLTASKNRKLNWVPVRIEDAISRAWPDNKQIEVWM